MGERIIKLGYEVAGWITMAAWLHVVYRVVETLVHIQTLSWGLYFYTTVLSYMVAQAASHLEHFYEEHVLYRFL